MAHFAKIENGIVTEVLVIPNEYENNGQEYLNSLGFAGTWIKTSYNANIRKKYASIGDTYDSINDYFLPPEPENHLGFDEESWQWIFPKPE